MDTFIRVLLAHDDPSVRAEMRLALAVEADIEVIGETSDPQQAQVQSVKLMPDVLLLGLNMAGVPALETVAYVRTHRPRLAILMIAHVDQTMHVRSLVAAGIAGYILKDELRMALARAVRVATRGDLWWSRALMQHVATSLIERPVGHALPSLTNREMAVLQLVVAGKTNREIASVLDISEKTIEKYLSDTFIKLGVATRVGAAVWAVRTGLA